MADIGERAYQAICERAKKNGISKYAEAQKIGISTEVLIGWNKYNYDPKAYFLQQMALAGYDTLWILTGQISDSVEVVRCKGCKCAKLPVSTLMVGKYVNCALYDPMPMMRCEDFCSYGERKEDGN